MTKPGAKVRKEPRANFGRPPPPAPPPVRAQAIPATSPSLAQRATRGRQVRKRHDARGNLIERYELKDGLLHGWRRVWAPSGQLLVETRYKNGKPEGLARSWNVHGRIVSEVTYRDGKHSGPFKSWWDNGQVKEQGTYFNDRRVGWYIWFDSDGTQLGRWHYAEPPVRQRRRRKKKRRGFFARLARSLGL